MSSRNLVVVVVGAHISVLVLAVVFGGCVKGKKVPKLTSAAPVQELRAPEAKPESILEPKGMVEETDLLVSREPEAIPPKADTALPPAPQATAVLGGERRAEVAGRKEAAIAGLAAQKEEAVTAAAEKREKKMEMAAEEKEKGLAAVAERQDKGPIVPEMKRQGAVLPAADGKKRKGEGGTHKVAPGESLGQISQQYGVPEAELAAANGMKRDSAVRVGQVLVIPGPAAAVAPKQKGKPVVEKKPVATAESTVGVKMPAGVAPAPARETGEKARVPGAVKTHVVQKGETLSSIAKRYRVSLKKLVEVNKIGDPSKIKAGRSLVIPQ